jgi:hypothetical protein
VTQPLEATHLQARSRAIGRRESSRRLRSPDARPYLQQEGRLRNIYSLMGTATRKRVFVFDNQDSRTSSIQWLRFWPYRTSRDDYLDPTRVHSSLTPWVAPEPLGARLAMRYSASTSNTFRFHDRYVPFGVRPSASFIYATGVRVGLLKGPRDDVCRRIFFAGGGTRFGVSNGQIRTTGSLWKSARR